MRMRVANRNIILPSMGSWTYRNYLTVGFIILFIVLWSIVFLVYEPAEVVQFIGVENGYILTFIIAFIGALTSITPVSIYPMLITMALGDLSPIPLIISAAAGLTLGDSLFYILGMEVRPLVKSKTKKKFNNVLKWVKNKPAWLVPVIIYFYIGFTPFPNNLLSGALAVTGYPFRKYIIPLFLGDLTLPVIIILLASRGINLF